MSKIRKLLSQIYRKFYVKIIPDSYEELNRATVDCKSILDLGCGVSSPIQYCTNKMYKVGIDAYLPSINKSKISKIHDKYYCMNVSDLKNKFKSKSFDCVLAFDLIEHLDKRKGIELMQTMEKIAAKKAIIFTPNGFMPQDALYGNDFQIHKSGWTWKEMRARGYKVIGINGLKCLKGKLTLPKYKPYCFWERVSEITQLFTRNRPKYALQILCVKKIN